MVGLFTEPPARPRKRAAAKKSTARNPATRKAAAKKAGVSAKKTMDKKLIALSEPYEVRDWCKSFRCSEAELRAAVARVGRSAAKVRAHLRGD